MLRLDSAVQHYAWGSATHLPELLGVEVDGRPFAELWMGAHPAAPSMVRGSGERRSVLDLVTEHPAEVLGQRVLDTFGPRLPYLFKVLSISRPLSLQVHPHVDQARAGFAREEAAGVPVDAPNRCFRDATHKPELTVALSRFEALCGFREPEQVRELLAGLDGALVSRLRTLLGPRPGVGDLRAAFEHLLAPMSANEVAEAVESCERRLAARDVSAVEPDPGRPATGTTQRVRAYETVASLAQWYPGDPGVIASLFLNRVTLEPGEAIFVPAGAVHAYLEGQALEIMASSDNVLRAGLTSKHIDVGALLECTDYIPGPPAYRPAERMDGATVHYRAPVEEFALAVTTLTEGDGAVALPDAGPRVLLCLEGELELTGGTDRLSLSRGQVVLVGHADGAIQVRGTGVVTTAFVPGEDGVPAGPASTDTASTDTAVTDTAATTGGTVSSNFSGTTPVTPPVPVKTSLR